MSVRSPAASCRDRRPRAPNRIVAPDIAVLINDAGGAILLQKDRAIEIDEIAKLANDEARCCAEAAAHHASDHHAQFGLARRSGDHQRLSQPAAFVELDIEYVEAPFKPGDVAQRERAFI